MKAVRILLGIFILFFFGSCTKCVMSNNHITTKGFEVAEVQLKAQLEVLKEPDEYPRTIDSEGKLKTTKMDDWTEGFFPGCLWYMYEFNKEDYWKDAAIKWTEALEPLKNTTTHHDIGFLMYCSYGNAYRLTGNEKYKNILIEAANSLCTRFNEKVGCIESWNYRKSWNGRDEWYYPVIIDNMMNLELLYFASRVTGNEKYARIANSHAKVTARNQFREDYSNYHVINYDEETGKVLHKATCQGFSDNSAWARGQAWAIYGFTMAYRETKNKDFLDVAVKTADFWLNNKRLPEDGIPYWDFNAGEPGYIPDWSYNPLRFDIIPRDASAAAITASALIELSGYVKNDGKKYFDAAERILKSLTSSDYLAEMGSNSNFILKHCVGSLPHNQEIDVPLVYADYYFMEALLRYMKR